MEFLNQLFLGHSTSHSIFILSLVIATGVAFGNLRIFGIHLGVAGVLFAGLIFGHFHLTIDKEILEFSRELGLILFVYTIGLHVGPGFFVSLKKNGLKFNLLAAFVVLMGAAITVIFITSGFISPAVGAGIFSGATTNTPSLGAAQEALSMIESVTPEIQNLPGLAYAMAYPFGILGIILSMIFIKIFGRINPANEAKLFEEEAMKHTKPLTTVNLSVDNVNLNNIKIKDLPLFKNLGVIISRVMHNQEVEIARPDTVLHRGDIIHVVGTKEKLVEFQTLVGSVSPISLRADVDSSLSARQMIVTRSDVVGKTVQEICLSSFYNIVITRITRADIEFAANPDMELQMADRVLVVGDDSAMDKIAVMIGDSPDELRKPHLMPIFIGIGVGIFLGSIPIYIPGIPAPIKLGMAGGPLLSAIFFSRIGHVGKLVWFMPRSANWFLREFGIALFLATVGLRCGDQFIQTILNGHGLLWISLGAMITIVPLACAALIARGWMKMNYLTLCGLLAGSTTNPPALAFANNQVKSSAVSLAYASVYPLVMILRVVAAQMIIIFFLKP